MLDIPDYQSVIDGVDIKILHETNLHERLSEPEYQDLVENDYLSINLVVDENNKCDLEPGVVSLAIIRLCSPHLLPTADGDEELALFQLFPQDILLEVVAKKTTRKEVFGLWVEARGLRGNVHFCFALLIHEIERTLATIQ
ncbi:MAG: hypothetical protein AAB388_04365 [Patescibacteria group bacterium]